MNNKFKKWNFLCVTINNLILYLTSHIQIQRIFFSTNEEELKLKLEWVKKYIDKNKMRLSETNKNKDVKTQGQWINAQIQNYQKNIL